MLQTIASLVTAVSVSIALWSAPGSATVADDGPLPVGAADYQLGGGYEPDERVVVLTRDSTDRPEPGVFSICYVNAFQTQPGEKTWWRDHHPELLIETKNGYRSDPDWPDEYVLNTSTKSRRIALAEHFADQIEGCAADGFGAVEFDNLDSWTRANLGSMTKSDNLDMARRYVQLATAAGLPAGQKNTTQFGNDGRDIAGFTFAVGEECDRWKECDAYTKVYGEQVIDIEYAGHLRKGTADFAEVCARKATPTMTVLRDLQLRTPSSAKYVYDVCDPNR